MRFVLYSEKTVAQCLTAINARMHVKATSTRPALDGWVEKSGTFSISMTETIVGKFSRRTALQAKVEREGGITIIRGSVPSGVNREGQAVVFVALALVALTIIGSGNVLVGLLLIPIAAYLYIPLHGDYLNSAVLVDEVEKTLKAKAKPPRKTADTAKAAKPVKPASASARPKPARSTTARKKAPVPAAASEFPEVPGEASPLKAPVSEKPSARPSAVAPRKVPVAESEFPEVPGEAPP